jgi:hypothetical protein
MKRFRTILTAAAVFLIAGFTACQTDSPVAPELTDITVRSLPAKKVYNIGEAFDPTGLEVMGTYSDGTEKPVTGYTLSTVDTATAGTKTVTVTLGGLTAEFTVRVRQAGSTLVSIAVTALPDKAHYVVGEAFDPTGLEVTGTYSDGTEEPVTEYTLSAVDTSTEGVKTVTVTLNGLEATFTVTVGDAALVSIAVTSLPEKTVYRKGEPFNKTGLVVTGIYGDGSSREETAYKMPLVDTTSAGEKTVTLSLGKLTAEFKIYVSGGNLLSIAVRRGPDRKGLNWGEAAVDLTGIEVTGTFSDAPDTPVIIPVGPKNVSGYDPALLPGYQLITLTVEGKTATFWVIVSALFFDYGKPRPKGAVITGSYSVPLGRTLVLAPVRWNIGDHAVYEWKVDGEVQPGAAAECFSFKPKTRKTYTVTVSTRDGEAYAEASTEVRCVDREGTYKRPKTSGSKAYTTDLLGYYPAPGQFVGGSSQKPWDPAKKGNSWAYSLGAFGGSIVYGFDHSVENTGGYSLKIFGNAFGGWSEPGTVWVMQDENGNRQPDDTWYELAGSENGKPSEKKRYALAYGAGNGTVDNMGVVGSFPDSTYYGDGYGFPAGSGNYTIYCGTRLLDKTSTDSEGVITNDGYVWGYVDNGASTEEDIYTSFKISDAIQADGTKADLKYIDFVRIQTAVSKYAGILGEISTETGIPFDYSMYY